LAIDREKTLDLAQKYILKGQSKKAIQEYLKLIEADPKDKRLYLKLGDLYFKNGENEKAINEYLKLADLYAEEDLNFRAISIYKKVLSIDPKRIEALHKIAILYTKEGLGGDARNYYKNILQIKPDDKEALKAIGSIQTPPQRKEIFQKAPSMESILPRHPLPSAKKPIDDKSDLYPSSTIGATVLSEETEVLSPDKDSEMHYHLGIAYKEMELFDYAISEFELASSIPSMKFDCYIMLGNCYMEKGDYNRSIEYYKMASEIKGLTSEKLARLHFSLGLAYEANGMFSEAINTFNMVLKFDHSFLEAQEKIKRLQQLQK
jgi:tetratricopeptide (TPR) repeat protein